MIDVGSLRSGSSKSCGCGAVRWGNKDALKHGLWKHPLRGTWRSMKERCYNPNAANYHRYGGRGITVHPRWRDSFETFVSDNASAALPGLSLDRIDPNGDYAPDNCRWATPKEQARNRCNTRVVVLGDLSKTIHEWADLYGITVRQIDMRIRSGWNMTDAITKPLRRHFSR